MANNSQDSINSSGQQDLDSMTTSTMVKSFSSEAQTTMQTISIDANDAAEFEEAKQSPSSVEEERTPGGGGTKELVGHHYKIVHLNDAQLLVPDLAPIPPNMVAGCCQHGMDFMGRQGNSFEDHDDGREAT